MGCCVSTGRRSASAAAGGDKKKRRKKRKVKVPHDDPDHNPNDEGAVLDGGEIGPVSHHHNSKRSGDGGAVAATHNPATAVPTHLPPMHSSQQHRHGGDHDDDGGEQKRDAVILNPLCMSSFVQNGRRNSSTSDIQSRSHSLLPIDTSSLSGAAADGRGGRGAYAANGGGRIANADDLESAKNALKRHQAATTTNKGHPHHRQQGEDAAAHRPHQQLASPDDGGQVRLGDSTSSTALTCSCDDLDDAMDGGGDDDAIMDVVRGLPERQVDALPLMVLVAQAQSGALSLSSAADIGSAFRTKMRFRDVEGWLAEVGHVPAAVRSLVHHGSNVSGNGGGGGGAGASGGGHDSSAVNKLTARQLEQNHRLLLQLKARTTTQQPPPMMNIIAASTAQQLQQPTSPPPCSPMLSVQPFVVQVAPGVGSAAGGGPSEEFPAAFEEELRRYSIASSTKKNRVPDRNFTDDEVGVSDFYAELEDEERRLSTIKHSSSDEDY